MKKIAGNLKKKIKLRHIILIIMALFILFNGSLFNLIHNRFEIYKLNKRNAELDKEYAALEEELKKLESGDLKYLEKISRVKYHMSKPGEVEVRIVKENK